MPSRIARVAVLAVLFCSTMGCELMTTITGDQTAEDIAGSTPKGVYRRFRYVVEVDTPKGVVKGHSVIGYRVDCRRSITVKSMCYVSERSEAAAVDLPNGTTLYSLLSREGQPQYACCASRFSWKDTPSIEYKEYRADSLPDLVMFGDDKDKSTIFIVDGTKKFGDEYIIKRIYLEPTTEAITNDIPRRLPWLPPTDRNFSGLIAGSLSGPVPGRYNKHDFIEGKDNDHAE